MGHLGHFFAAANCSKLFFRGLGLVLHGKQTTRSLAQPNSLQTPCFFRSLFACFPKASWRSCVFTRCETKQWSSSQPLEACGLWTLTPRGLMTGGGRAKHRGDPRLVPSLAAAPAFGKPPPARAQSSSRGEKGRRWRKNVVVVIFHYFEWFACFGLCWGESLDKCGHRFECLEWFENRSLDMVCDGRVQVNVLTTNVVMVFWVTCVFWNVLRWKSWWQMWYSRELFWVCCFLYIVCLEGENYLMSLICIYVLYIYIYFFFLPPPTRIELNPTRSHRTQPKNGGYHVPGTRY